MIDVLFVTPNVEKSIPKESHGTLLLATILHEKGISVELLPFYRMGNPEKFDDFLNAAEAILREKQPRILGCYVRCDCYHIMLRLAERAKALGCIVVFGGPQADILARETIEEIPYVDYILCGEGETTVYPFFSSLLRSDPDLSVAGLVYRNGNEVVVNPRPALLHDLDSLPHVDYSLLPPEATIQKTDFFVIDAGRGCPFSCTFCSTNTFWGRTYRMKSPQRIIEEVKRAHERFGVKRFSFNHDMFTMNRKLVSEICRLLKELDFKVIWMCSARIDCLDEELIDIMVDAGLMGVYIGIETGSPRMQKLINKNLKLERIQSVVRYLGSKNVPVTTSFIYGFPQETEEDVSQTLSLMMELLEMGRVHTQSHLCAFLPGTALTETYRDALVPAADFSDSTGTQALTQCSELIAAHPRLFPHFSEYRTELRTKLRHFPLFNRVYRALRVPYAYLSKAYPAERCIQMYYDFAEANREILEDDSLDADAKFLRILKKNAFPQRFAQDPHFAVVNDICQIHAAKLAVQIGDTESVTMSSCILPETAESCTDILQCPVEWCMITYKRDADGRLQTIIRQF